MSRPDLDAIAGHRSVIRESHLQPPSTRTRHLRAELDAARADYPYGSDVG